MTYHISNFHAVKSSVVSAFSLSRTVAPLRKFGKYVSLPREQTPPRSRHPPGSRHPPQHSMLGQGYVFTGMCDSVHGGSASVHAGIPPHPGADTPGADTPWKQTPPGSRHPLEADIPLEQTPPQEQTPPRADTPLEQTSPREQTPPPPKQSMLGDTVNAQAVRIILECNLVYFNYLKLDIVLKPT